MANSTENTAEETAIVLDPQPSVLRTDVEGSTKRDYIALKMFTTMVEKCITQATEDSLRGKNYISASGNKVKLSSVTVFTVY